MAAKKNPAPRAAKRKPEPAKQKMVRDSFNMPEGDYALIAELKARALGGELEVKKSQLLRAGLKVLAALGDKQFKAALAAAPAVKTGRPKK